MPTNAITQDMFKVITSSLSRILNDSCSDRRVLVPVCMNLINESDALTVKETETYEQVSVDVQNHIYFANKYHCKRYYAGIAGICVLLDMNNATERDLDIVDAAMYLKFLREHMYRYDFNVTRHLTKPVVFVLGSHCPSGQFSCDNRECVSDWLILDGRNDCSDGSDEKQELGMCSVSSIHGSSIRGTLEDCELCHRDNCTCGVHFYHCKNAGCIHWHLFCDGHIDCAEGDDEQSCVNFLPWLDQDTHPFIADNSNVFQKCDEFSIYQFTCPHLRVCISIDRYNDGYPDCPVYVDVNEDLLITDMKPDLIPAAYTVEDEPGDDDTTECSIGHMPCPFSLNHQCFPFHRLCVYDKAPNGRRLRHCINGGHLFHCSHVQCSGWFKCPHSYCLPLGRVCDGNRDCPWGEDELECPVSGRLLCPGMFRCHQGGCVHPVHVCDGIRDCPGLGEDELLCQRSLCPTGCYCQAASMYCDKQTVLYGNYNLFRSLVIYSNTFTGISIQDGQYLVSISINNCYMPGIPTNLLQTSENVILLDLSQNNLQQVDWKDLYSNRRVMHLNLSRNNIGSIHKSALVTLTNLSVFDISQNQLQSIPGTLFQNARKLTFLNLSSNELMHVTFIQLSKLNTLDLSNNNLGYVYLHIIPKSSQVYGDTNGLCCIFYATVCVVPVNLTCLCNANLSKVEQATLWVIGSAIITTSVALIAIRFTFDVGVQKAPLISKDLANFCVGISSVMVGLKDSLFFKSLLSSPGGGKHLFCIITSVINLQAYSILVLMELIDVLSLHLVTKHWNVPTEEIQTRIRRICLGIWSYIIAISLIFISLQISDQHEMINYGHSCSVIFSHAHKLSSKLLLFHLLLTYFLGYCLQTGAARRILETISESNKAMSSFGSTKTSKKTTAVNKLLLFHLPMAIVSLPLLCCVILSLAGFSFTNEEEFPLVMYVLPLPHIINMYNSAVLNRRSVIKARKEK